MLLTNQFHDIIPGSSIRQVYDRCDIDYGIIKDIAEKHMYRAMENLCKHIRAEHGYLVLNPNPTKGFGLVKVGDKTAFVNGIAPKGYTCIEKLKMDNTVTFDGNICESKHYRVVFDENMHIVSLLDRKNMREVIKYGSRGNELRVYADYPEKYDAWEWSEYSLEKYVTIDDVQSVEQIQDGARFGIRISRKFMESAIVQTIWMYDDIDRIDFDLYMDWHQKHQGVKVAFDVNVRSARATYEIQYGTIERPTHKNTSWDRAKYEVCGQRFADLSESGYGVALLNDCKYGYDIHGSLMTLSLLRSPTYPDPDADQGVMTCTYSLYPHANQNSMYVLDIYSHAYALNNPLILCKATGEYDSIPCEYTPVVCDKPNILCEVIKEAEDNEAYIFRLFECIGSNTCARIRFGFDVKSAELCDMCENPIKILDVIDNTITLDFTVYEIHTIRIT